MTNNIENNPLIASSTAPYGAPMFDKIELEHYIPAFNYAIEQAKGEIDAIINNPDLPTFENSIVALENSGEKLSEITSIFFNLNSCNTNPDMQQIALEVMPMLTKFSNDISLNQELFSRVKVAYSDAKSRGLSGEDMRIAQNCYKGFVRGGADLEGEDKDRYRALSTSLSDLSLRFEQNLLAATNDFTLHITDSSQLAGLPDFVVDAAAESAKEQQKEGWLFTLHAPSFQPFMQYSQDRELRHKMWSAYSSRCYGGQCDNRDIVKQMVTERLAKANLLGYKTHAEYILEQNMAKTAERVMQFALDLNNKSIDGARKEVLEIEKFAKEQMGFDEEQLEPWDFAFYSEKYKKMLFDLDDELLKPYFMLENVENGVFMLCNKLYDITFHQNLELPLYHQDVKAYEVKDSGGDVIALLYLDFFPRESKNSGAWMTSYREQKIEDGQRVLPIISVVCNFTKPTSTSPSLLTFNELTTLLHEMGHALHGVFANSKYSSISGTNVARDFVELPSQIMENWAFEPQFLNLWAKHYQTGEDIDSSYIKRIEDSRYYLACYHTSRQLSFVLNDMAWHMIEDNVEKEVNEFEKEAIKATQVLPAKPEACFSVAFSHIFAGGYSAGYYSYKWAELLEADAYNLFKENGIFDKGTASKFKDNILSKGDSDDAMNLYVAFRGCEPDSNALLEKMGIKNNKSL